MSMPISAQLSSARRAIRQDARKRGAWRLVSMGLLSFVLVMMIAHRWPRIAGLCGLLAAVATIVYALWPRWRVQRILENPIALARWIEDRRPAYRNDLSSTLEFEARPAESADAEMLRASLRARMEEALAHNPDNWRDILPRDGRDIERRSTIGMFALAIVLMLTPAFRGTDGASPSEAEAKQAAQKLPELMVIGAVDINVQPPQYTGLPEQTLANVTGGLRVQEGSRIRIAVQTVLHVSEAWIEREGDDQRERVQLDGGYNFIHEVTATQNETLRFGFVVAGEEVLDQRSFQVRVARDAPPAITLYEPEGDMRVTPGEVIELTYDVSDDFGIRDVHLVWHFSGREQDAERILLLDDGAGTFAEDTAPFDTAPLYMQPGDEVIVYLEGRDNVSFRPANIGESRAVTLFVEEENDHFDDLLTLKEELFESLLKQLGSALPIPLYQIEPHDKKGFALTPVYDLSEEENAENLATLATSLQEDGGPVHQQLQAVVELLEQVEGMDARELTLFSTMYAGLDEAYRGLDERLAGLEAAVDQEYVTAQHLRTIAPASISFIEDVERAALVLSSLIAEHKADDVARALEELADIRGRLRELLEEYRETKNPETRARIERELDRLSRRMNELMERLSAQIERLPEEHFNVEGLEQGEVQEQVDSLQDAMQSLRDSVASGDADGAMDAFEQLSDNLDALYQEFGDPSLGVDGDTLSEFDQAMGEISDDISIVEAMQRAVEEETAKMERELSEEKLQEHREALEAQLERALETVKEAQDHAESAKLPAEDEAVNKALRDAEASLNNLASRLEQRDLAVAEDAALEAMDALNKLRDESARSRRFSTDKDESKSLRDTERASRKDAANMRKLAEEFSQWQQTLQPEIGDERSEQLESLQERQQQAAERLQQLQQRMEEIGEKFPMMKPGEDDSDMQRAGEGMKQSAESLSQRQARRAHDGQEQALDSLQQMREGLKQRMAQHRQQLQRQAERGQRGGTKRDKVDVSQESDRDLRQRHQIMDAMREKSLEAWKDPIRQYYESLVR